MRRAPWFIATAHSELPCKGPRDCACSPLIIIGRKLSVVIQNQEALRRRSMGCAAQLVDDDVFNFQRQRTLSDASKLRNGRPGDVHELSLKLTIGT